MLAGLQADTVREIEKGLRTKPRFTTLRKLADALGVEPASLTNYVATALGEKTEALPSEPSSQTSVSGGILALTADPVTRVADYRRCLEAAEGEIFISGTSMISLSEDSAELLGEKLINGSEVKLLIADPDWIQANPQVLTFISADERRKTFHLEIRNSIAKLESMKIDLPTDACARFAMRAYRTFFPYIVTGFRNQDRGQAVVEITDYLPERFRPRLTLQHLGTDCLFAMVYDKFSSLWNSHLTSGVF